MIKFCRYCDEGSWVSLCILLGKHGSFLDLDCSVFVRFSVIFLRYGGI